MKVKEIQKLIFTILLLYLGFQYVNVLIKWPLLSYGTVALIIYLLYLLWNLLLWKWKRFPFNLITIGIGFYNYPVLDGEWNIEYWSSYNFDEKNNSYRQSGKGTLNIKQNYSSIFLKGSFDGSNFESYFAELKWKENKDWFLVYAYINKPTAIQITNSPSGGMHEGFCYLDVINEYTLEGYYSNDENRKTRGKIKFTKVLK